MADERRQQPQQQSAPDDVRQQQSAPDDVRRASWPLAAALIGTLVVVILGGLLLVRQRQPQPSLAAAPPLLTAAPTGAATAEAHAAATTPPPTGAPVAPVAAAATGTSAAAAAPGTPQAVAAPPTPRPPTPVPATPTPPAAAAPAEATAVVTVIATVPILLVQGTPIAGTPPPTATAEPGAWWDLRMDVPPDQADAVLAAYFDLLQRWAQAVYDVDPGKLQQVDAGPQLPFDLKLMQQRQAEGHALKIDEQHTRTRVLWVDNAQATVFDEYISRSVEVDATTKQEIPNDDPPDTLRYMFLMKKVDGAWKIVESMRVTNNPSD